MIKKKPTKRFKNTSSEDSISAILAREDIREIRSLFAFDRRNTNEEVLFKFELWGRYFYPGYFMDETKSYVIDDAEAHREIDIRNIAVYRGTDPNPDGKSVFIDIAYRGFGKTTRTKLLNAFFLGNDMDHYRRYWKIESEDLANAVQLVTDLYNMYVTARVRHFYPEVFAKTPEKRVETMGDFETATGVKVVAKQVGVTQRGALQDEYRPDYIWFDDFESRKTLRSLPKLTTIKENMDEAYDGLSIRGGAIYTCNYVSERGNVHGLIQKYPENTLITPIKGSVSIIQSAGIAEAVWTDGPVTWPAAYKPRMVESILSKSEDAAGEYLCTPAAGTNIYFDRDSLKKQVPKKPVREIAGFKIFYEYQPGHRYGSGHDVAGGLGLDSSTSAFIDFYQMPARVVATYANNTVKPDAFGDEICSQADRYGAPIVAVENNRFDACIGRLKQIYENMFVRMEKVTRVGTPPRVREWGWNTNSMSKGTMLSELKSAVADGRLELTDSAVIAELRAYTNDDFMDGDVDVRLTTRHFDLLTAVAIAWQMRNHAEATDSSGVGYVQPPYEPQSEFEGGANNLSTGFSPRPIFPGEMQDASLNYIQPPYEGQSEYES